MKRYVNEFATDFLKWYENASPEIYATASTYISKIVNLCQKGYISNIEAIQCIININDHIQAH